MKEPPFSLFSPSVGIKGFGYLAETGRKDSKVLNQQNNNRRDGRESGCMNNI